MRTAALGLLCLTAVGTVAQHSTSSSTSFSTLSSFSRSDFSGSQFTYSSPTGQSTVDTSTESRPTGNATATTTGTASESQSTRSSKTHSLTLIGGGASASSNATTSTASSTTSSSAAPSNTVPCNNYPEFCTRQYSNITEVCSHNSAFALQNNAGSNQKFGVRDQLNDGVRMIQGETHFVNNTVFNCHTTCKLLNVGPWQSELETVADWLRDNPYDVVTWLIANSDLVSVDKFVPAIQNSGIAQYLYEPDFVPQHRDQWPTLGEMILSGQRLVMFMDYNANQTAVPYILDQFTHIWETPFSPTDPNFPCTVGRPPNLATKDARDQFMYLVNHNLNTAVDLSAILGASLDASSGAGSDTTILIPNTAQINRTNGQFNQFGQLEAMSLNCTEKWTRPPNFLVVDYYNFGDPKPGSVFEVAARANGVTYNRPCCGPAASSAAASAVLPRLGGVAVLAAVAVLLAV